VLTRQCRERLRGVYIAIGNLSGICFDKRTEREDRALELTRGAHRTGVVEVSPGKIASARPCKARSIRPDKRLACASATGATLILAEIASVAPWANDGAHLAPVEVF
jgi:hypothetical protein